MLLNNLGIVGYGVFSSSTTIEDPNNKVGSIYLMTTTSGAATALLGFSMFILFGPGNMAPLSLPVQGGNITVSRNNSTWTITKTPTTAVGELTLARIR